MPVGSAWFIWQRPNIQHPRPKTQDPKSQHRTWEGSRREILKDDQVVPMHDLDPIEPPRADFGRTEISDAACELGSIEVAYPDDFAGRKPAFAPRDAGRQQTLAFFPQRLVCAFINEQRALGMVK